MSVDAVEIRKGHEVNVKSLESYFKKHLNKFGGSIVEILQFKHGQSNPTYYIKDNTNNEFVLRKKPYGKLLPSAHAIEREYMILNALKNTGVPVPETYLLCEDLDIIGTVFYVMNFVKGRIFKDVKLSQFTPLERSKMYEEIIKVLANMHSLDYQSIGLSNYGQSGNYYERQLKRWSQQYSKSKTKEIVEMENLMKWLGENIPTVNETSIVHGDFRLDNLVWHPTELRILAVLDWELSTIGHPFADVAYCCMPYVLPPNLEHLSGFGDIDFSTYGIPSQKDFLQLYFMIRKIPPVQSFTFYISFSLFKLAAILQGVYKRCLEGNASSSEARIVGGLAEHLCKVAWKIVSTPKLSFESTLSMFNYSDRATKILMNLLDFMDKHIYPNEKLYSEQEKEYGSKWQTIPIITELKEKAKEAGLWNLFLPYPSKHGCGLTNLEYAPICEVMGRSIMFAEVFNCSAPDTGNMEVLDQYGTEEQKEKWLKPLLDGKIRSAFAMTEPDTASSDATNISCEIRPEGDFYIINGKKWWTSGSSHPDCKILIVMGKTSNDGPVYKRQSMILVPIDTEGVKVVRPLTVFGYDDSPHGHSEVHFYNVRVPKSNILLGEGRGFDIAQGRLGPGRIHHCMRLIGLTERCLELGIKRIWSRKTFNKKLAHHGTVMQSIALSRIEIEQARLLTMKAAYSMDTLGNKIAKDQIAAIKVVAPRMACKVIDRMIQLFGAAGLSEDFPIARAYAIARTLRIADGPDEVHLQQIAKLEYLKMKSKL